LGLRGGTGNGLVAPFAPPAEGGGGIAPPPPDELVDRCLLPLVNEGLRCLHEGVARTPADVDIVYVLGYGFPAWRGGPMHWAEQQLGLPYVLRRMREIGALRPELGAAFAQRWSPSPLLVAAVEGRTSLAEALARSRGAARKSKL
jgi:3-hydroxyacyl-CoA dehydrogenase